MARRSGGTESLVRVFSFDFRISNFYIFCTKVQINFYFHIRVSRDERFQIRYIKKYVKFQFLKLSRSDR